VTLVAAQTTTQLHGAVRWLPCTASHTPFSAVHATGCTHGVRAKQHPHPATSGLGHPRLSTLPGTRLQDSYRYLHSPSCCASPSPSWGSPTSAGVSPTTLAHPLMQQMQDWTHCRRCPAVTPQPPLLCQLRCHWHLHHLPLPLHRLVVAGCRLGCRHRRMAAPRRGRWWSCRRPGPLLASQQTGPAKAMQFILSMCAHKPKLPNQVLSQSLLCTPAVNSAR
jgi:hypothetical protein